MPFRSLAKVSFDSSVNEMISKINYDKKVIQQIDTPNFDKVVQRMKDGQMLKAKRLSDFLK